MTDPTASDPAPATGDTLATGAAPQAAARPPRWRRRLLILVALVVGLRLALGVGLSPIARAALAAGGLEGEWASLEVDLLDARVEIGGLRLSPRSGPGEGSAEGSPDEMPMVAAAIVVLDVDVGALLKGHLRVERLVLEGARVHLDRDATGPWNFAPLMGDGAPSAPSEPSPAGPILFDLPLEITQARIQDLGVRVRDLQAVPPVDLTSRTSLTLTDLGAEGRPAELDLRVVSAECLDLFRVRGTGALRSEGADLSLELTLAGLRPAAARGLFVAAGLDPRAKRLIAEARLQLTASPLEGNPEQVAARLTLDRTGVRADGVEALGLEQFEVQVDTLGAGVLEVGSVLLEGLVAEAALEADGTLTFAGLGPAPGQSSAPTSAPAVATAEAPVEGSATGGSTDPASSAPSLRWSLERVEFKESSLSFTDRDLGEGHRLTAQLDTLTAGPVSSASGAPASSVQLSGTIPGVVEEIRIDGTIDSVAPRFVGGGGLKLDGVSPGELAPYLALAGIAPAFERGSFELDRLDVDGLDFSARGLRVTDSGAELAAVDVAHIAVGGEDGVQAQVSGARGRVRRRLDDSIEGVGLRFNLPPKGQSVEAAPEPESAKEAAPSAPFAVPDVWLPRLDLQFESLELISDGSDLMPVTIGPIALTAGRAEGAGAAAETFVATAKGKIRVAQDFSASVALDGSEEGLLRISGETAVRGLNLDPLEEWIELLGVRSELKDGSLDARFDLGLRASDGGPDLSLRVGPVRLEDRAGAERTEWLDLKELKVDGLRSGAGVTAVIESIRLEQPRLRLERDGDGGWAALGMRALVPTSDGDGVPAVEDAAGGEPVPRPASPSGWLSVGEAQVNGANVTLVDQAEDAGPPVVVDATLGLRDVAPGSGAPPATVTAQVESGGARWGVSGSVQPDPEALSVDLALTIEGLAREAVQWLMPPGVSLALTQGEARAHVQGSWSQPEGGGDALAVVVEDLDLRERDAQRPLLGASLLRLTVPRLDVAGGVVDVEDVKVEDLAIELVRLEDGGLRVAGVDLVPVDGEEVSTEDPVLTPGPRRRLESVRVGALDLGLKQLQLSTEGTTAAPFVATSRIRLKDAVVFDGADFLDDAPPVELEITASAAPGNAALTLDLSLTPFDPEPGFDGTMQLDGLDGAFLRSVFPERQVPAGEAGLDGGSLSVSIETEFRWRRSGPLDFDLRNGFGLGLEVNDLALRRTADGPIDLGLDLLSLDGSNIAPRVGRFEFGRVEIEHPRAIVRRVEGGLQVAGMLVVPDAEDTRGPTGQPEGAGGAMAGAGEPTDPEAPSDAEPAPQAPEGEAAASESAPRAPRTNIAIDDLLLRDLDFLYEDQTLSPALSIPLVALDAEVRGLSSRMMTEPRPLRYSLSLGGGKVSLPVRLEQTSLIRGVAEGVAGAVSSREAETITYEDRPLFRELVSSGQLTFYPATSGWMQVALQGFELTALRGAAVASGIDIGDGVLDVNSRTRLASSRGGHLDSTVSLAHLSLSEPDGGPISRFLKLPAPLDTVIFVLKNEQGEIRLPLAFDFGGGSTMGLAEISAKASAAFLRLVTEALAAAPLRAVGSVTDVVGLGGLVGGRDRTPKYAGMTAELDFDVGSAHVDRDLTPSLRAIVKAMSKDPLLELEGIHHFGTDDIDRARELANPDSDVALQLLRSLRRKRDELSRERGELAVEARASLSLGRTGEFQEAQASLVRLSRELGEVESRVDQVAALLGRNTGGKAERRRKRVALDIAQSRMDALMRALIRAGVDQTRINLKRPRFQKPDPEDAGARSRILVQTRAGTPRKGFFGRVLSFFSF